MNDASRRLGDHVTICLREREYSRRNNYRKNLKILKTIICKGKTTFRKVWEKHSSKHISCENGHIFFDNYRYFYSGTNLSGSPHLYYKLPSVPTNRKIEDALILHSSQDALHLSRCHQKDCLITITANNWIQISDLKTGNILKELCLSSRLNFRELAWSVDQDTFVIRSIHNKIPAFARQAGVPLSSLVMVLAIFHVFPLRFVGMIEIEKKIWGSDVMDAMLAGGLLILMYQSGFVKMFNFEDILQKYKIKSDQSVWMNNEGLPINIKVTECPPVLFEVRCAQHSVQLGGFPWHFMITPYGSMGCFLVYSCSDRQVIDGGHLDLDNNSIEIDRACFHGDESGRILHIGHDTVSVLEIKTGCDNICQLQKSFDVIIKEDEIHKKDELDNILSTRTSSGRTIKKKINIDEIGDDNNEVTIYNVDYENELDVLCVSSVIYGTEKRTGSLGLYDNQNGDLLRKISLLEPYCEFYEHRVFMDGDTIIQIIKANNSKFLCIVYKLFGDVDEDLCDIDDKSRTSTTRRTRGRRRQ